MNVLNNFFGWLGCDKNFGWYCEVMKKCFFGNLIILMSWLLGEVLEKIMFLVVIVL